MEYSGYSAPGSRISGMKFQVFRNENSSQTNAYSHYSKYSHSGLIPNERALKLERSVKDSSFSIAYSNFLDASITQSIVL